MTENIRNQIFLSASFPSGERGREVEPYDPSAIADAVTAISRAALLSDGHLLFGGHPTITPLILLIGTELEVKGRVDIFQSRWFEHQITDETWRLIRSEVGRIHWTQRRENLKSSLHYMREEMLQSSRPAAAVFVGGMSGILDEYEAFGRLHQGVPRIGLTGPGGAAARLPIEELPPSSRIDVTSRHYPFVASRIIDYVFERSPR